MYQACYPLGVCIGKLSFNLLYAADRFICRVGTKQGHSISVVFPRSQKVLITL